MMSRAQFHRLADERENLVQIPIHHVAAGLFIRAKDERLDHQRHTPAFALRFDLEDVFDALVGDFRLAGDAEKIHYHAGRIEAHGLLGRIADHTAEERARQLGAVDIGHVGAQHERGLFLAGNALEQFRLADGKLDRIRCRFDEGTHTILEIFDALQKAALVEKAVVDGHVEAAVGLGIEETVEAKGFHREGAQSVSAGALRGKWGKRLGNKRALSFQCHPERSRRIPSLQQW